MAGSLREAIETFMRITGASESLAIRKLEEFRGDINAAVNSHFSDGYNYNPYHPPIVPQHTYATTSGESQGGQNRLLQLLDAAKSLKASSLLDTNCRRIYDQIRRSSSIGRPPSISRPVGIRPTPEFNGLPAQPPHPSQTPTYGDGYHTSSSSYPEIGNDNEDRMIKAALEASKQDSDLELLQRQLQQEDDDLTDAISLSLQMAEQENAIRELQVEKKDEELASKIGRNTAGSSGSKVLVTANWNTSFHHHQEKDDFSYKEWGGITSKDFNESVLLEAAHFGTISKSSSDNSLPALLLQNDIIPGISRGSNLLPSPSSTTQKSERPREEMGKMLATQEAPIPLEPKIDDKDTVSLLLRMPDGCRHECLFLKSDKLQLLFNFIDDKVAMKPGSYRVVRPYPRSAFGVENGPLMLRELGLTGKQETLFVELI